MALCLDPIAPKAGSGAYENTQLDRSLHPHSAAWPFRLSDSESSWACQTLARSFLALRFDAIAQRQLREGEARLVRLEALRG